MINFDGHGSDIVWLDITVAADEGRAGRKWVRSNGQSHCVELTNRLDQNAVMQNRFERVKVARSTRFQSGNEPA